MDKKPGSNEPPGALRVDPARTRQRVERDLKGLRYELDFPRKLRRSFREQTVLWVGAAVAVGALLVFLPRSRKTVYVDAKGHQAPQPVQSKLLETGFLLGALRIAVTLLRPVLMNFVRDKMSGRANSSRSSSKW